MSNVQNQQHFLSLPPGHEKPKKNSETIYDGETGSGQTHNKKNEICAYRLASQIKKIFNVKKVSRQDQVEKHLILHLNILLVPCLPAAHERISFFCPIAVRYNHLFFSSSEGKVKNFYMQKRLKNHTCPLVMRWSCRIRGAS